MSFKLPWTNRTFAHSIAYPFRTTGTGVSHIVVSVAFISPGSFLVMVLIYFTLFFAYQWIFHDISGNGNHIFIEFRIPKIRISPIHIGLSVVVNKNSRIDILTAIHNQRFSDRVFEGAERGIGYQYTHTRSAWCRTIEIEFTVTLNTMRRPCTVFLIFCPFEIFQGGYCTMISPIDHISTTIQ